jgi:hypothetical protein
MPVHDWTRVDTGTFHAFHTLWIGEIMKALNSGLLPDRYYALTERVASRVQPDALTFPGRYLVIRQISGHQVVALVEIVSPSNKDRKFHVRELAEKVVRSLESGVHVLLIDLLPAAQHDPRGLHGAVWGYFDTRPYHPPTDEPLTLASYAWDGDAPAAFLESVAVGRPLVDMPLFLSSELYVYVPLEPTYLAAYRGMPAFWRDVLEQPSSPPSPE